MGYPNRCRIAAIIQPAAFLALITLFPARFAVAADSSTLAPADASVQKEDQVVALNPFEVRAEQDNSYNALDTNSITRFSTDLYKLPVTADVFTETFMRDIAATTVEDMIVDYGGASVTSQDSGASAAFNNQPGDSVGSIGTPSTINLRGLPASVHRDGFIAAAPTAFGATGLTDNFSVERVDVTSGPHSLLYGDVSGGGVINIVSKQGRFNRKSARLDYRIDQYGSRRGTADVNIGGKNVAVRAAFVNGDTRYRRLNLGGTTNGTYAQIAFRLPFRSVLRVSQQDTNSFMVSSTGNGNINNFLYNRDANGNIVRDANGIPTVNNSDPRHNLSLDYLTASHQVSDLGYIFGPGFDLTNIDSFRGWEHSNWNRDDYTNVTLETNLNRWLSSQLSLAYDDSVYDSPNNASSLTPALGLPGSGNNPLPFTAISQTNPGDSLAHTRVVGTRWSLLATNEFFRGKARSQTLIGGEATRRDGAQNGVAYSYYLLNPDGSLYVDPTKLNNGEYGRIRLTASPTLWAAVQNGLVAEPFFRPMTPIVHAVNTVQNTPNYGQLASWARLQRRELNPALVSPDNPLGADRTGNGEYNVGHTITHAYNIANVTEWFDGRLETLTGGRWIGERATNVGPTAMTVLKYTTKVTYSAGASYRLLPWVRVFADVSSAYNPSPQPNDPLGTPLRPPSGSALQPDVGVKFRALDDRINGSITWVPGNTIKDDRVNIDNTYRDAINPNGINGRYLGIGGGFQGTVNDDKKSSDIDASITLNVTRRWRSRLSFHETDGRFGKTVTYPQVYNDQFYTDSAGEVTYGQGGPPIMVDPKTGKVLATGGTPLTLALINGTGVLSANPDPDSGRIQNGTLRSALMTTGPNGSTAATAATGLPISAIQYNWSDPNGHKGFITPISAGDKTIGYAHYTFAFTNRYEFDRTWLKGFGVLTNVRASYQYRSHYYPVYAAGQVPGTTPFNRLNRQLYLRPTIATLDLGLSYTRKIGRRYVWSSRLNVQNVLNHYRLLFPPNATGATPLVNAYVETAEPRLWIWSNSISF